MSDDLTTIGALKNEVHAFCAARHWEPFHSPKNLVMALAVEVAELMEPMRWLDCEATRRMTQDPAMREALADELADVANLLLNLCISLDIDLSDAFRAKLIKNAVKYPAPTPESERSGGSI